MCLRMWSTCISGLSRPTDICSITLSTSSPATTTCGIRSPTLHPTSQQAEQFRPASYRFIPKFYQCLHKMNLMDAVLRIRKMKVRLLSNEEHDRLLRIVWKNCKGGADAQRQVMRGDVLHILNSFTLSEEMAENRCSLESNSIGQTEIAPIELKCKPGLLFVPLQSMDPENILELAAEYPVGLLLSTPTSTDHFHEEVLLMKVFDKVNIMPEVIGSGSLQIAKGNVWRENGDIKMILKMNGENKANSEKEKEEDGPIDENNSNSHDSEDEMPVLEKEIDSEFRESTNEKELPPQLTAAEPLTPRQIKSGQFTFDCRLNRDIMADIVAQYVGKSKCYVKRYIERNFNRLFGEAMEKLLSAVNEYTRQQSQAARTPRDSLPDAHQSEENGGQQLNQVAEGSADGIPVNTIFQTKIQRNGPIRHKKASCSKLNRLGPFTRPSAREWTNSANIPCSE
ncbi:unnamed protein product [Caenorhabditis sp. 36 PRJEB53466]|nr:unnamed protein product [Caenorhabditis sp. 36 PRJEB53466]